jgi:hypothetical protein
MLEVAQIVVHPGHHHRAGPVPRAGLGGEQGLPGGRSRLDRSRGSGDGHAELGSHGSSSIGDRHRPATPMLSAADLRSTARIG